MKRVGLFVGIDNYTNGITSLSCACSDAKGLSLAFAKAQFDSVEQLLNSEGHCETILKKAQDLTANLEEGDLFVLYFAGHGREINGTHYLVGPTGYADKMLYQRGSLSIPELVTVTDHPGINRLFILDCCRSNLLADRAGTFCTDSSRDIAINAALKQTSSSNKKIFPPLILNSCSAGEQAFEDREAKHGYFTKSMLISLQDRSIRNFTEFRKALKANITDTPGEQNICWNGNLDRWENIFLFPEWERNAPKPEPPPKPEKKTLTAQERKKFIEVSVDLKDFMDNLKERDGVPEPILEKSQEFVDKYMEFSEMEMSVPAYMILLELQKDLEVLKPKFKMFDQLEESKGKAAALEKKLKKQDKTISDHCRNLKKYAKSSEQSGYYGMALDYWDQLIREYEKSENAVSPVPVHPNPVPVPPRPVPVPPRPVPVSPRPVPVPPRPVPFFGPRPVPVPPRPVPVPPRPVPMVSRPVQAPPPLATPVNRKTEKKTSENIKKAKAVFEQISDDSIFVAPNIPDGKLQSAIGSYAFGVKPDSILLLIDDTIFQGTGEGMVVTENALFAKTSGAGMLRFEFSESSFFSSKGKKILINDCEWAQLGLPKESSVKKLAEGLNLLSGAEEPKLPEYLKKMKAIVDSNVFVAPNIPIAKLRNAINSYAPMLNPRDVLLLVDDTLFGGSREGMIITEDAVYAKELASDPQGQMLISKTKFTCCNKTISVNGYKFVNLVLPENNTITELTEILNCLSQGE